MLGCLVTTPIQIVIWGGCFTHISFIPELIIHQPGLSARSAAEHGRLKAVLVVLPCQVAPSFGDLLARVVDPNKCLLYITRILLDFIGYHIHV